MTIEVVTFHLHGQTVPYMGEMVSKDVRTAGISQSINLGQDVEIMILTKLLVSVVYETV